MTNRERKKFNKVINKYYHLYGFRYQHLYVTSMEVMDKDSCVLDIHLWDEKKKDFGPYLFMVQNYNGFQEGDIVPPQHYFRPYKMINTWDGVKASCAPLYIDNVFTLPKFTGITKEDVVNCTRYFCKEILDNYWVWNVSFGTDKEENKCLEKGQEKKEGQ